MRRIKKLFKLIMGSYLLFMNPTYAINLCGCFGYCENAPSEAMELTPTQEDSIPNIDEIDRTKILGRGKQGIVYRTKKPEWAVKEFYSKVNNAGTIEEKFFQRVYGKGSAKMKGGYLFMREKPGLKLYQAKTKYPKEFLEAILENKMKNMIDKMHNEFNMSHNDLHPDNILFDIDTLEFNAIDFALTNDINISDETVDYKAYEKILKDMYPNGFPQQN